jgi:WD40 repeat protein
VYVYGDGFQFVRTWLIDDPNEVVSIVPLYPNKILVAFADNSIVVLELPTLEVLDLLPSTWLSSKDGDLTSIYCDLPSEKNFVYCGTSEGNVFILDVMESAIRICDYSLNAVDLGISGQKMAITDIQISPRNDRFLALGCDGPNIETGMVVVFDLEKHKLHKNFKTAAVSNITWHHLGEILYCSTRNGIVHSINVEKGAVANSWNAKVELLEECNDEDDEEGANVVSIRKLSWLAPQSNAMTDTGCLFALLSELMNRISKYVTIYIVSEFFQPLAPVIMIICKM